jgi:membrane-associated phospholipid phosphatase
MPPAVGLTLLAMLLAAGANRAVFLALNHAGHPLGMLFWLHLTMLGDGAVALALVLPCIRRAPHCFWGALAAAVFAALWTQVTKQLVDMPRPLAALASGQFFQAGPAYRQVSFPSGHAAAAFAMAGIWIMGTNGNGSGSALSLTLLRALLLLFATLVSLSRIMVGVHWPADVLWGMLGGWLGAWLGLALHARWRWRTAGVGGLLAGLVLSGVAAALLVSRHIHIPEVMAVQRLIGCICLLWGAREIAAMLPQWWRAEWWRIQRWRILRRRAQWRRMGMRRPRSRQDAKGGADG